jgi:hypothetical protein
LLYFQPIYNAFSFDHKFSKVMRVVFTLSCLLALLRCDASTANNNAGHSLASPLRPMPSSQTTKKSLTLTDYQPLAKKLLSDAAVVRGGAPPTKNGLPKALAGAVAFAAIEKAVKMGLNAAKIQYPAQLGACILLFFIMCLMDLMDPKSAAFLFDSLSPSAALLAKWFPIFFIPGLVLLPLSPPIGGTIDVSCMLLFNFLCIRCHPNRRFSRIRRCRF